jgi:ElaB/YqjD/DUF883 family membrane-anchored ribosome-binding protein
MNQKPLDKKIKRDAAKVKKDINTLAGDSLKRASGFVDDAGTAAENAFEDVSTWVEDSVSNAGEEIERISEKAKETASNVAAEVKKNVGHGLSQYNKKAQIIADRVPGNIGEKAAHYPWVSITIALALGLMVGYILKSGTRNFD